MRIRSLPRLLMRSASILHVDMDAFFVSVELLARPELRGLPVVVGGQRDQRGVVSSASYEARQYGIHSAMPLRTAAKLCPQAIFLDGHHELYGAWSDRVAAILEKYSPIVEMASIDEAYLDLAGTERLHGPPLAAAHKLLREITSTTGLPCSGGLGATRLVAKVASDQAKPRGLVWVAPGSEEAFLAPLGVRRIPGIGRVTESALKNIGVETIAQLQAIPLSRLEEDFGRWGTALYRKARGIDSYEFFIDAEPKSISHNRTFGTDTNDRAQLETTLSHLCQKASKRLRDAGLHARTVTLTVRYADFRTITRGHTLAEPSDLDGEFLKAIRDLFSRAWDGAAMLRLVGVELSSFSAGSGQLGSARSRPPREARTTGARHGPSARPFRILESAIRRLATQSRRSRLNRRHEPSRTIIPPSMATPPNLSQDTPRRRHRVRAFWAQVTEGIEFQQLWGQFLSEAKASYVLYSRDVDWEEIEQERSRVKRFFRSMSASFQAMLMKLSPARRVLLLLAILFFFIQPDVHWGASRDLKLHLGTLGVAILFLLLAVELADRVTMKRDLEIASEIQQWLVPRHPPIVDGLDIAFATRPQNTVAGDYYDAFLRPVLPRGADAPPILFVVADVAGKSVPAALLMATFQASLHALTSTPATLNEIAIGLDRYCRAYSLEGRRFTTAFLAEVNLATRKLVYINAGHNDPILRRSSGQIERLSAGGPPFGLPLFSESEIPYASGEVQLHADDFLFIFTDGVVEAVNDAGGEYGEGRLVSCIQKSAAGSANELMRSAMEEVNVFVGFARQHDDITCLAVRVSK